MSEEKNNHPVEEGDQERFYENKIQKRYAHNVIKVSQISVTRVLIKTPSNIYNPSFEENVGLWEQYWSENGKKLFERRISDRDLC
ncbi:hypothetical protein HC026_12125 [Lactobacillus sp. LC28-10]|uniref:Uncharacterized protein n=1 Tax=Secundilactobacillus angelensis TaxID=2722706 RepID=A0ABX1L0B0_9LACO|nr:hypothetical protein [Secundilactobacillus angelensis]MCH5463516.1 hypothetical protein [Secundilactobacillus angelensis]NLR19634.1 hypothetical protein [Secundilactobacillus angelensis]